jgi:hypothetical protein
MMFTDNGCRLYRHFFLAFNLNRETHFLIDGGSFWFKQFLSFKRWFDYFLPLWRIDSLLLLIDDKLLGAAELNVIGLSIRARLLLLALLLLDALLQLLLQLTHEVVVVAEFRVGCLTATLGALLQTLLKHLLNGLDFLTNDLIEDYVF